MNFVKERFQGSSFTIEKVDEWADFIHGFGDRSLNLPTAGDRAVTAAWDELSSGYRLLLPKQEHGKKVIKLSEPLEDIDSFISSPPTADAWICSLDVLTEQKLICGVRTADCFPVLIRCKGYVAAIHCGWRGAQAGILLDVITQLARLGCPQRECQIVIGPGAQAKSYEIGDDVGSKLLAAYEFVNFPNSTDVPPPVEERDGRKFGVLPNLLMAQAIFSGVKQDRILVHQACTIADSAYFSFRREKEEAGRQLSFVGPRQG